MNKIKISVLSLCLFYLFQTTANGQREWLEKIVPLQTKIAEVEKMFSVEPKRTNGSLGFYLPEGNLFVYYSAGNCVSGDFGKWKVEEGTVTVVVFYPEKEKKPSYFKLEKKGTVRGQDSGHDVYYNPKTGLEFTTQFKKVTAIRYYPAEKFQDLQCQD